MTQSDAQLLYDWLVQRYGDPSKGSAVATFIDSDRHYQRDRGTKHDADRRMRREKRHQDDKRYK
jgi:hypothetical protein